MKNIGEQEILFITENKDFNIKATGVNLHSSKESQVAKKVAEVKENFGQIINQVNFIISDANSQVAESGYGLDEITLSLGFNAKGKIAFIAEAGIEASIELTFKKK